MEANYRIFDLNGRLLEQIDELSHCSYGKPAVCKDQAIRIGATCYFKSIPGSQKNIAACKNTFAIFGKGEDAVWVLIIKTIFDKHGAIVLKNENDIRPKIEWLIRENRVKSIDDIEVRLCPIIKELA